MNLMIEPKDSFVKIDTLIDKIEEFDKYKIFLDDFGVLKGGLNALELPNIILRGVMSCSWVSIMWTLSPRHLPTWKNSGSPIPTDRT